jgi:hypothetical protein
MESEMFCQLSRNKLPSILDKNKEVFGVASLPKTNIIWADSNFYKKYGETLFPSTFQYYANTRKICFSPQKFEINLPAIKRRYDNLEDYATSSLSHEGSHYAHDFVTGFEVGDVLQTLGKEKQVKDLICLGIIEGIAEYGTSETLRKLGLPQLEEKRMEDIEKNLGYGKEHLQVNANEIVHGLSPRKSKIILGYVVTATALKYIDDFQSEGPDYFRKFVTEWRPKKISQFDAFKILTDVI